MSQVTTHVLDTAVGRPAAGVPVRLTVPATDATLGEGVTDADGRVGALGPEQVPPGVYRLVFDTSRYFGDRQAYYPEVAVTFEIADAEHHHVPLLLSPFGYSTYRGS